MTFALEAANEPNTPWNFSNFCLKTTIRVISYSLESLCGVFRVFFPFKASQKYYIHLSTYLENHNEIERYIFVCWDIFIQIVFKVDFLLENRVIFN